MRSSPVRLAPLLLLLAGCGAELLRDVDGEQANLAVAELERHGIAADKVGGGDDGRYRLTVPRDRLAEAARLLAAAELPRPPRSGLVAAFQKSSLVPTPLEERARLYGAIAGDLERTLELYPAVERARVHLTIDPGALGDAPTPPSAAVLLRLRPKGDVNPDEVKRLVSKATAGLDAGRIDLMTVRAPAEPVAAAALVGKERGGYLALGALFAVVLLSLALLYAARRLQQEREERAGAKGRPSLAKA